MNIPNKPIHAAVLVALLRQAITKPDLSLCPNLEWFIQEARDLLGMEVAGSTVAGAIDDLTFARILIAPYTGRWRFTSSWTPGSPGSVIPRLREVVRRWEGDSEWAVARVRTELDLHFQRDRKAARKAQALPFAERMRERREKRKGSGDL